MQQAYAKREPMGAPAIHSLNGAGRAAWNRFVEQCPSATFFHLAEWQEVIERAFGHKTFYLYALEGEQITGVLPLVQVRSRLFGHSLSSTPFCVYGGIVATTDAAQLALERRATELAQELKVDYLEMRNGQRQQDWPEKSLYVTFRKSISADHDENMKAIPRKQRAMVRKGIKAGLVSEIDNNIDRFFPAYAESVRNLGTPVFSRRYFETLQDVFGDRCEILTVLHGQEVVCAVMNFYFREEVLPYYGGGGMLAREFKGNDFMYWEVMRRAADRGFRIFDYGRSKEGTGSYHFKKNWGFEPVPLHYQYYLVKARDLPNVNPTNPKYRLFIDVWKRLPLSFANRLGPMLSRSLG